MLFINYCGGVGGWVANCTDGLAWAGGGGSPSTAPPVLPPSLAVPGHLALCQLIQFLAFFCPASQSLSLSLCFIISLSLFFFLSLSPFLFLLSCDVVIKGILGVRRSCRVCLFLCLFGGGGVLFHYSGSMDTGSISRDRDNPPTPHTRTRTPIYTHTPAHI